MIIRCSCCGKQAVSYYVSQYDEYCTVREGAKSGFKSNECICGYCAKDLDEYGRFPEERDECLYSTTDDL
jgi:hypothetical protein